jgi:DNA invertase Pin-like site-specific DNA recombinase
MKVGYARVSTTDQNLDLQINALRKEGCELIYKEKKSALALRPELERMMENLSEGDIVVVWKIDRLARSLSHLISIIEEMKRRHINFISLQDNIDTNSIMGEFLLHP